MRNKVKLIVTVMVLCLLVTGCDNVEKKVENGVAEKEYLSEIIDSVVIANVLEEYEEADLVDLEVVEKDESDDGKAVTVKGISLEKACEEEYLVTYTKNLEGWELSSIELSKSEGLSKDKLLDYGFSWADNYVKLEKVRTDFESKYREYDVSGIDIVLPRLKKAEPHKSEGEIVQVVRAKIGHKDGRAELYDIEYVLDEDEDWLFNGSTYVKDI